MVDKKKFVFFVVSFLAVIALLLYFVLAVSLPPTGIIFNGNVTPYYDEGVFTINWTDGGQNSTGNYTVYLWMNNNYVSSTPNANSSALGYKWSNITEANYTFAISAVNTTNKEGINSSNVSMYVDRTPPVITLPNYVNSTIKKNTDMLILNISLSDAKSGLTNTVCLVDVNGTNQSIIPSNGWCNSSNIYLSNLTDGIKLIKVYANDTVNNLIVNNSYTVFINTTSPRDLIFNQNVSANFDEGIFFVNWTSGGGSAGNYTIYVFVNNIYNSSVKNDSATGYSFSNITEANYTFIIQAMNFTNMGGLNSTNVSMYIDRTPPLVNWTGSGYNNVTYKKNTDYLTLNISVSDASSGVASGNSYCIFNISGTNESVAVSNGWCNTTYLNLTGLSDGNHSINIWANDTINNVGVNLSSYVVWIDTTAPPVPTFSCTPTSVYVAETITCSCSGTDASSGVNTTSYTVNPSTVETGAFSTSCTITDKTGNSVISSISYIVGIIKSSGGSSSSISTWTNTYIQDDKEFSEKNQINKNMAIKNRIKIKLDKETHYISVVGLTSTTATVNVSSVSQQKIMSVGEEWKAEITGDNYYDILIKLNGISSNKANITLNYIHELIGGEVSGADLNQNNQENTTNGDNVSGTENKKQSNNIYYILGAAIILILIILLILIYKRKPSHK